MYKFGVSTSAGLLVLMNGAFAADLGPTSPDRSAPAAMGLISSGEFEAAIGYTDLSGDFGGEDDGYLSGSAAGRWSIPFGNSFSAQIDVFAEANDDEPGDNDYEHSFGGAGHLSWRDPNSYLFGVFAGVAGADLGSNGDATILFGGVEAQAYLDNITLLGQLGYLDSDSTDDDADFEDVFFVRGGARYFFNDNLKASGEVSYADGTLDGVDGWLVDWGAELEYGLDQYPASLFVAYDGGRYEQPSEGDDMTEHVIWLGARWKFGTSSLMETDRYGATLDLPRIGRWAGQMGGPLE